MTPSELLLVEALRRGYHLEQTVEDGMLVERLYRPDGSVAVVAKLPLEPDEEEKGYGHGV